MSEASFYFKSIVTLFWSSIGSGIQPSYKLELGLGLCRKSQTNDLG